MRSPCCLRFVGEADAMSKFSDRDPALTHGRVRAAIYRVNGDATIIALPGSTLVSLISELDSFGLISLPFEAEPGFFLALSSKMTLSRPRDEKPPRRED